MKKALAYYLSYYFKGFYETSQGELIGCFGANVWHQSVSKKGATTFNRRALRKMTLSLITLIIKLSIILHLDIQHNDT
jgi:hypothetical protein